jgi:hypothetical protein
MSGQIRGTVVRHRYVCAERRTPERLRDALHYMQERPLDRDEHAVDRRLFTAHTDGLSRQEAQARLIEHTGRRVAYHRLILSPDGPVADLSRWTRLVLTDLARRRGQELYWVAVAHRNTAHPHVHVLVGGTGTRRRGLARPADLILRPDDYALLRAAGDRHGREAARAERSLEEVIRAELDREVAGLLRALADALTEEGMVMPRDPFEEGAHCSASTREAAFARAMANGRRSEGKESR